MTIKEAKKAALQIILEGKTKQETFETLKVTSKLPYEELADIIEPIPSLSARNKYKRLNTILVMLLSFTVLIKIIAGVPLLIENGIEWFPVLFLLPIINVIILRGVLKFEVGIHKYAAIWTIIGILNSLKDIIDKPFEPLMIIDFGIYGGIIGLGFYLNNKLCPDYLTVKEHYQNNQGQDKMRKVIKFED